MTTDELNSIVAQVISAIRTNSKTIDQLSAVTSLGDDDYFEVNGGRKVSYSVLMNLINSLSSTEQDSIKTLINKNVLQKVSFITQADQATLSISSAGKTITCSVPIATDSTSGFITAAEKVKIKSAYDMAETARNSAATNADNIKSIQDSVDTLEAHDNYAYTETLKNTTLPAIEKSINSIQDSVGAADGIAPLGSDRKVSTDYLPSSVDNVKEFRGFISGVTPQMASSSVSSDASTAAVFFNSDTNRFILGVMKTIASDSSDVTIAKAAASTDSSAASGGTAIGGTIQPASLYTYYNNWGDAELFGSEIDIENGRIPDKDKIYVCTSTNTTYRWDGTTLVKVGSSLELGKTSDTAFPGDEGKELQDDVETLKVRVNNAAGHLIDIAIYPCTGIWDGNGNEPSYGVWLCPSESGGVVFRSFGSSDFFGYAEEEYNVDEEANQINIFRIDSVLYHVVDGKFLSLGGSSVGNCYNLTSELPLADELYYTMDSASKYYAPSVVQAQGKAVLGLQITFAIADGSWKDYQYIGKTTNKEDFLNIDNWIDLAGLSAGTEPMLNINKLLKTTDTMSLGSALEKLIDYEKKSGISYRKSGMVITYLRDNSTKPHTWETKQFCGDVDDFTAANVDLWKDFGNGGGGSVTTTSKIDVSSDDKKKEVPNSGAVSDFVNDTAIVDFEEQADPDNYIFQGVNKAGAAVGSAIKFSKSAGTGAQTGSVLSIYCDQSVWGAFGATIALDVAIKSVSYDGDTEVLGTIRTISILDATTNMELWSSAVNTASSSSANDRKFSFDFTDYMTSASNKDFIIRATDADGNTRSKTISVYAVDVTCSCLNRLNYASDYALAVGSTESKSIPMYKFANNISTAQGIRVTTEMFYEGEWKVLGTAIVTDSYSHNISINPSNVFGGGEKLKHGSYPIRITGVDVASGVQGNTVYTAVMCVDSTSSEPIVSIRYDDSSNGTVRLYDSVAVDVAAYTPGKTSTEVKVYIDGSVVQTLNCGTNDTYQVSKQIQGYATDGSKTLDIYAQSGSVTTETISVVVQGSAIDAAMKDGAVFGFDFSTRSNSETDHSIVDNGYEMVVEGSNYNSNGFCTILGENVLRIAENVKGEIKYAPFSSAALETAGCALQFAFSTKSIKNKNAMLMQCYDPASGVGFYIKGNQICLTALNGAPKSKTVGFKCGEKITVAIVVEPGSKTVTYTPKLNGSSGTSVDYSFVKLYVNGEEVGAIGYLPGTNALRQFKTITFDSSDGDFNLNYFLAYNTYMEWLQAYQNYLCKISDVKAMIAEYDAENVLDTTGKPSMSLMAAKGIPYYVIVADQTTFNNFDYALNGGTSTSDQFSCTLYYYNPQHPECNFKAVNVLWRRQGTTSAQRPIKNDRFNFAKKNKTTGLKATITLLNPDDSTQLGRDAIKAAKEGKVYVAEKGFFVNTITVKVDYSDSSNANDCGVCNMMNATFRALGNSYMTPAQRAFEGVQMLDSGEALERVIEMDHSTKNHPIAVFRATSDTLQDAWFHAKGNWKEDKGEQVALGFKDTLGYNKGCLNYGDFVEYFGVRDEALADIEKRFLAEAAEDGTSIDTSKVYLISQYCGRDYAIYRYKNSKWTRSTGSMKQVNGKWVVTGDVLNPVTGYELLQYNGMDWFQGVETIDDMMAMTTQKSSWANKLVAEGTLVPAWTYYFECMIDDDQLQLDLVQGKKVPYDLFNLLRFFNSCDYSKVDGWETIWQQNAYRYMSIESAMAYTAFTDYLAAVDQRAKNMQPMFFLEDGCSVTNGVYSGYKNMEPTRMYLNKVYDCDTCNGKDNDGGVSIDAELDPNKPTDEEAGYSNPYMGRGSILFNNMDKCQTLWNSNDNGATTITLKNVVKDMRNLTTQVDGKTIAPFSPDGALYYFVDSIIEFWPKVVSSYDGERKYIDNTNIANQLYFYALHGSGRTSLPRFIQQRWAIRDGYYQTGDFFSNPLTIRMIALSDDSKIGITAAATGYFGIGNDAGQSTAETVYLEEGESYEFSKFEHGEAQQRIYMPGRLAKLDLSEMSLAAADFSSLELAEELILGGDKHTSNPATGYGNLTSVTLGTMPFLRKLDVRNTTAMSVDASSCPRIEEILADNTELTTCKLAQTSPIETLTLPSTMTSLELVNLPNLSYPGGLSVGGFDYISRLWIEGSKNIDVEKLVMSVADSKNLNEIRIPDINMTAHSKVLYTLKTLGVKGLDANGTAYEEEGVRCSGLAGRWIMADLIDEEELDKNISGSLAAYFPELTLYNSQYSTICYSDLADDTANISNIDESTGYKFGNTYTIPSHWQLLDKKCHTQKATYNSKTGEMHCVQISDSSYTELADGTSFDPADASGLGFDVMKYIVPFYMKGVNDYKNQEKYTFLSALGTEPISTSTKVRRDTLANLLVKSLSAIFIDEYEIGDEYNADNLSDNANMNVYEFDVEGMKQVRWPGVNSASVGAIFLDENDKVISKYNMEIGTAQFDFVYGDYIFIDVPAGAKKFIFTSYAGYDDQEAIAVDSSEIEAIEPDWVECGDYLLGVYGGYVDSLNRMRSISGVQTRRGDGTSTTNADWAYDENGDLTNTIVPTSTMHYTGTDLINLCRMRGKGFQAQDKNMENELAQIIYGIVGDRDIQAKCGYGCSSDYTTGAGNSYGNITYRGTSSGYRGNILFGIQNYIACDWENVDYCGVNISNYPAWRKGKYSEGDSSFPVDAKWHIYDPVTKTERVVQGLNSSNYCIGRVKHGRYCDIIASKFTSDTSKWNQNYADKQEYNHSRGRLPRRAGGNAGAYFGLAYVYANGGGSVSYSNNGVRLAFRQKGAIVFD
jgi:hypothetical protein